MMKDWHFWMLTGALFNIAFSVSSNPADGITSVVAFVSGVYLMITEGRK